MICYSKVKKGTFERTRENDGGSFSGRLSLFALPMVYLREGTVILGTWLIFELPIESCQKWSSSAFKR